MKAATRCRKLVEVYGKTEVSAIEVKPAGVEGGSRDRVLSEGFPAQNLCGGCVVEGFLPAERAVLHRISASKRVFFFGWRAKHVAWQMLRALGEEQKVLGRNGSSWLFREMLLVPSVILLFEMFK